MDTKAVPWLWAKALGSATFLLAILWLIWGWGGVKIGLISYGALWAFSAVIVVLAILHDEFIRPRTIPYPPAYRTVRLLRFLLPSKVYTTAFDPTVTSFREDIFAAVGDGDVARVRWLSVILIFLLWIKAALLFPAALITSGRQFWDAISGK